MNPLTFGLTTTCLLLAVLHWFPWPKRLHAIANYTLGTGSIFIGMTIWRENWTIWIFPLTAGVAVCICYAIDYLLNVRVRARLHESQRGNVRGSACD